MKKVILSGQIEVPLAELEVVRCALIVHIEATRAEAGCRVFKVEERPTEEETFDVHEEFDSKSAFEYHQKHVSQSTWGKVTKNVRRIYTIDGLDD